ncbi:MAG: anaerobic glycerol-3-phosphate dehydrogenase subunit C [Pirellulales bacterium]
MDIEQKRVEEDLRGQIAGDVLCDDLNVQLYSSDASIYEMLPLGVVRPRSVDDVVATVQYAAEHGISLHPRGSGSGLAGESLGRGLIVDFSRYFRRILETDDSWVRVQSGVVLNRLNAHLAKQNRLFGPDPALSHVTTMGSVVALNAAGSRWPRYGSARDHLLSLQVVLATGEVVRLNNPTGFDRFGAKQSAPIRRVDNYGATGKNSNVSSMQSEGHGGPPDAAAPDPISRLTVGLESILRRHAGPIRERRPRSVVNRSGYHLFDLQRGAHLDLGQLMLGSEGTLAIVTEATFSTDPVPQQVGSSLFFFDSLDKAARGAVELSTLGLVACDLMDRRHLSLARESDPRYELLIPQAAEAVLLVEYHAETTDSLRQQLERTRRQLLHKTQLASSCYVAEDRQDYEMLWQLSRHYVPLLYRLKGSSRPIPFIEDIAVPPAALPQFIQQLQSTLKQLHVTASIFGHALHGQLHVRPFLDLANSVDVRTMETLATELYAHVWDLGGTISGEHGDGLSRTPYLDGQYKELTHAFREVKELFDPRNLLNPGKVVPLSSVPNSSDPNPPTRLTDNLRQIGYSPLGTQKANQTPDTSDSAEFLTLQLDWQPQEMAYTARGCNGCAACRSQDPDTRMCPIFRYAPREEASPRAKANLVRGLLAGSLPVGAVYEEAFKKIADLCVHCHMCRLECPANVDIPKMMVEAKAAYLETNGQGLHDWVLTRVDSLCEIASRMSRLANWAVANRFARWLIEKTLGIAQGRKLPRFARQPFLQVATQRRLHRTIPPSTSSTSAGGTPIGSATKIEKVLYFVDTYANYCDTQLAEAMVATLEHNQISVYVPNTQQYAAMSMISQGMLGPARLVAEQNVALLAEAVRQGYTILCTEPSAALALTHEYPMLLADDPDARLVAAHTMDACHYLWRWHQQGKLQLDFGPLPLSVGYHVPCHVKALDIGTPTENLLDLIPGLQLERLEKGCSGIAGTFGLKHKNYRNSLRAGLPLLTSIRAGQFQVGVTECSACKIQMEQGTHKPTIHPIKILALAYGLKPEFQQLLDRPNEELVVT